MPSAQLAPSDETRERTELQTLISDMPPNARSVIAQVHRKSRSMGSRRNFCSHPDHPGLNRFTGTTRLWPWLLTHGLGLAAGYGLGSLIFGYFTSKSELEKKQQELIAQYEQHFQQQKKLCSDLAASNPKS